MTRLPGRLLSFVVDPLLTLLRCADDAVTAVRLFPALFVMLGLSLMLGGASVAQSTAPAAESAKTAAADETDDGPAANPARPTVSTPATLTPVGYLQFETGMLGASESPELAWRYGFNEVMKLTVAPRLELIVSDEPFDRYNVGHGSASGNGTAEVFLGVQAVAFPGRGSEADDRRELLPPAL